MGQQDELFEKAIASYGPAIERLVRGYEADAEKRRDLLQDIHIALWQSFKSFDGRCSMRTWVYRVAHNRAVSHVRWNSANTHVVADFDEAEAMPAVGVSGETHLDRQRDLQRLMSLIQTLPPVDRQTMLLYLEGLNTDEIAEVTGMTATNVGTKVYRLKKLLARRFHGEKPNAE